MWDLSFVINTKNGFKVLKLSDFLPVFFQNCAKNTAKCVTINCVVYNMPSQSDVYITVKARLWNSTLVADYPRVDQVTIVSSIDISIPDIYNIQRLNGDDHLDVGDNFSKFALFSTFNKIEFNSFLIFYFILSSLHTPIQIYTFNRAMDRYQFGL